MLSIREHLSRRGGKQQQEQDHSGDPRYMSFAEEVVFEQNKRREEIGRFYKDEMGAEERAAVLETMRAERAVRGAYIQTYYERGHEYPPLPEAAVEGLRNAEALYDDWARYCSGSAYVEGIEARPDVIRARDQKEAGVDSALRSLASVRGIEPWVIENEERFHQASKCVPRLSPQRVGMLEALGATVTPTQFNQRPEYIHRFIMPGTAQPRQGK